MTLDQVTIKVVIIVSLLAALVLFFVNRNTHGSRATQKLAVVLLVAFGVTVAWSPNISNEIAHKLGVGRGADLLLYVLALAFVFSLLVHYIRSKEEARRIAVLARRVAILEARMKMPPE
jgi:small membrane protein